MPHPKPASRPETETGGRPDRVSPARHTVTLAHPADFEGWRAAVRTALALDLAPDALTWRVEGETGDLLGGDAPLPPAPATPGLRVPPAFVEAAREAVQHRDPERFALLHGVLGRIQAGERR
ncbi:MAG: hypothetical protein AAF321_00305, partial [Pseudomonadota bacterium]